MKVDVEIVINAVCLGIKEAEDPKDDKRQYLEIDEFEVLPNKYGFGEEKRNIVIRPTKWHIAEYPVTYCNECLTQGKRVEAPFSSHTKHLSVGWCNEHYRIKERALNPCPNCDEGYMTFGTSDMYCSHCNYREPHVHDVKVRLDGIFALTPSQEKVTGKLPQEFTCTCTSWETPEEHTKRRETLKKED